MSARYRCMTSSVHICLTVVTGFLIVIFYRNQLQRSSSIETLCAREVHRMVLGGLNVQILHQEMLFTSYMFWWHEEKILKNHKVVFKFEWISSEYGWFRIKDLPFHIRRRSRVSYSDTWHVFGKFGLYTKKKIFPETSKIRRNSGNPKKTEIVVFRISKKSIWKFYQIDLIDLTPVAGLNLLWWKVSNPQNSPQNSQILKLWQVMSR